MKYSMEEILPVLEDYTVMKDYDKVIKKVDLIREWTPRICIFRVIVKGMFPVADREFVTQSFGIEPSKDVRDLDNLNRTSLC